MTGTYIIIMAALILLSAYFSATETAFSSLYKTRLKTLAEKGNKKAALTCSLSERYDRLISTILIGNNIVNIATASLGTVIFVKLYGDIGATVSTVVVTVTVLIFGEITPKTIAKDCPEKFAMFSSPFIQILIWLFTPLNFLFSLWKRLIFRIFKPQNDSKITHDELLMLVDEVRQDGSIDNDEGELLHNAVKFTEREAGDIITHRVDIEAVSTDATNDEIATAFSESGYSRIIVYDESIDNIIGVLHQKDFYNYENEPDKNIRDMISPVLFVLKTEKISTLLRKLQKNKSHISVVLDEYGGTYGIATMEDILEELVGEIWDEHDEIPDPIRKIDNEKFIVDCSVDLEELCGYFGVKIESEMTSVSGWILEKLDHIANVGDTVECDGFTIVVTAIENHRITEAEIIKKSSQQIPSGS